MLLRGFGSDASFSAVQDPHGRGLLLRDFLETTFDLLVAIDEAKAWPLVRRDIAEVSGWALSRLFPRLSVEHELDLARVWMRSGRRHTWDWDRMVVAIAGIPASATELKPVIQELSDLLDQYPGQARKKAEHRQLVSRRLRELEGG